MQAKARCRSDAARAELAAPACPFELPPLLPPLLPPCRRLRQLCEPAGGAARPGRPPELRLQDGGWVGGWGRALWAAAGQGVGADAGCGGAARSCQVLPCRTRLTAAPSPTRQVEPDFLPMLGNAAGTPPGPGAPSPPCLPLHPAPRPPGRHRPLPAAALPSGAPAPCSACQQSAPAPPPCPPTRQVDTDFLLMLAVAQYLLNTSQGGWGCIAAAAALELCRGQLRTALALRSSPCACAFPAGAGQGRAAALLSDTVPAARGTALNANLTYGGGLEGFQAWVPPGLDGQGTGRQAPAAPPPSSPRRGRPPAQVSCWMPTPRWSWTWPAPLPPTPPPPTSSTCVRACPWGELAATAGCEALDALPPPPAARPGLRAR